MNQYCRYCANANLVGDDIFYCQPRNEVYGIEKSKRINKCKLWEFNEYDLWSMDENGNSRTYNQRGSYIERHKQEEAENYSLFEGVREAENIELQEQQTLF